MNTHMLYPRDSMIREEIVKSWIEKKIIANMTMQIILGMKIQYSRFFLISFFGG